MFGKYTLSHSSLKAPIIALSQVLDIPCVKILIASSYKIVDSQSKIDYPQNQSSIAI